MLLHHTQLSSRTSLTTRGICAPLTLGSPGKALRLSSMESGSSGRVLQSCRGDLDRLHRYHMNRCANISSVACQRRDSHWCNRRAWRLRILVTRYVVTTRKDAKVTRPAAPIQRFKNKSLNWPSWFRHFKVVLTSMAGIRARELCSWCQIWMRLR